MEDGNDRAAAYFTGFSVGERHHCCSASTGIVAWVLQEMPQEARVCYEERQIRWPTEAYGDWRNEMLHNLRASPGDRGPVVCSVYIGTHENEQFTFQVAGDRGFAEDRTYRVSIYTDISGG